MALHCKLAFSWPPSFTARNILADARDNNAHFVSHGIFPLVRVPLQGAQGLKRSYQLGSISQWQRIRTKMPRLNKSFHRSLHFYRHQWRKHGRCLTRSITKFFRFVLSQNTRFARRLDNSLLNANIVPLNNNTYLARDISDAFRNALGKCVEIVCIDSQLTDVYLHVNRNFKLIHAGTEYSGFDAGDQIYFAIVGAENPVLMSAAEQIFGAGGKRMRPALVFLVSRATAELVGLKELTKEHRRLAEIIEMIHTASLIHDDVLDDSDMRRGKETVHQLYGTRIAVLAGDFMFAQSSWYLANLENLEVIKLISQVIKDFASGEIKQASSLFDCDVELEEYLIKSYYKTASLIAASTKGAAIFSGVDSSVSTQMFEYGKNLGLSFQVVDDILDFTQSAEQLGKPAGCDLAKGNLTAPVIFALEQEPKLRDIIESEFCETGSLDVAIKLVESSGGIERAQELAREKADLAIQNLQSLPQSSFRLALEEMVYFNLERID